MAAWGLVATGYAVAIVAAAVMAPVASSRRWLCALAAVGYAAVGWIAAPSSLSAVQLVVPGAMLLVGYWLPSVIFGAPQRWLEAWLLRTDRRVFEALDLDARLRRLPHAGLELLEAAYFADYLVVGGGAIVAAMSGVEAVKGYWTAVLGAELACYAALPWLRSRPPRAIEPSGVLETRAPFARRINLAILSRASVQANTLPSGHVAGAAAAALSFALVHPLLGALLGVVAITIAVAAVLGRYHYVADVVLGALVALAAAPIARFAG